MRNKRLRRFVVLTALMLGMTLTLIGCMQTRIVDRIKILTVLGVDQKNGLYQTIGLYMDHMENDRIKSIHGEGDTVELMLSQMNMQSPHTIQTGKLRMLVFSRRMAEQGLDSFLHTFCRSPITSTSMILAVSEEPPQEMFQSLKGKNREGLPYHLIEQNVTSDNAPLNNLHIFLFNCYGTGRDAFAPYLKRNKYGKIEFTGLGIFQYDRLKLVLDAKETLLLKMMKGRGKGRILPVQINAGSEEHVAALSLLKEEPSMHFALDHGEALKMTIDLHLIGMLKEIPRMNMRSEITYKYTVSELEQQINDNAIKLLNKLRDNGVDPLGLGDFVRGHQRSWDEEDFYKREYPRMRFEVHTHLTLKESGIGY